MIQTPDSVIMIKLDDNSHEIKIRQCLSFPPIVRMTNSDTTQNHVQYGSELILHSPLDSVLQLSYNDNDPTYENPITNPEKPDENAKTNFSVNISCGDGIRSLGLQSAPEGRRKCSEGRHPGGT